MPNHLIDRLVFSPDPEDYQPMCRSCHARYDRGSAS